MRSRDDNEETQAGRYQVYAKQKGHWSAIGDPMRREAAAARVAEMRAVGRFEEPHCVPL
jgi:hypothetical protein